MKYIIEVEYPAVGNTDLTEIEHKLESLLKFDEPVSRHELSVQLGICERMVRRHIKALREKRKDYVIISTSHGKGYSKTRDPDKIGRYEGEMKHRAKEIIVTILQAHFCRLRILDTTQDLGLTDAKEIKL